MRYLVIAHHDNHYLHEQTLKTVQAVLGITRQYDVGVLGYKADNVVQMAAKLPGCSQVMHWDNEAFAHNIPENIVPCLAQWMSDYDTMVFASNTTSKNLLPRLAARMDISPITDICAVLDVNTFKRPIYAGNAVATVRTNQPKNILSVRTASFTPCDIATSQAQTITVNQSVVANELSQFVALQAKNSDKPDLLSSKIVVSGGRGLGSKEAFNQVESLASRLDAAVGASRAAVDAGFVPNDYQVGQTGKIIAPDVYIALGISGAIQHLAGMKDSRIIIAINKDPDAPIFQVADYGLVADIFEIMPKLEQYLVEKSSK